MKLWKWTAVAAALVAALPIHAAEPKRVTGEELQQWLAEGYVIAGYSITFAGNRYLAEIYPDGTASLNWRSSPNRADDWHAKGYNVKEEQLCRSWQGRPESCSDIYQIGESTYFALNAAGKAGSVFVKLPPFEEMKKLAVAPATTVKQVSPEERLANLVDHMRISSPDGDGPFPAVVQAPGCSGFVRGRGMYNPAKQYLLGMGYVVVRADYFKARGKSVCDGGAVTTDEAAADLKLVVEHVKSLPYVDKDRVVAMGWSFGGGAVLLAESQGDLAVNRIVAFYPTCHQVKQWQSETPTLVQTGEADTIAPPLDCERLFSGSPSATFKTYPDAYHAFDNALLPAKRESRHGGLSGHNPEATKAAWAEIENFLAK